MKDHSAPKVAILLATYNGQDHLTDQLDSFDAQTHRNWVVWASDDGSGDDTCSILESYRSRWGGDRLSIRSGPREGFVANFLSLTCNASIEADYYAYSDQDDIWEAEKLQRAVDRLRSVSDGTPALYCSRTRLVDIHNSDLGFSPSFRKPTGFSNALVQSIGGGNTMLFNNAARELLRAAGDNVDVVVHDWWVYLVVSGCGGEVFYDPYPSLRYRQHDRNLVGGNSAWSDRFSRLRSYWGGEFKAWNERNIRALRTIEDRLTPPNRRVLEQFSIARQHSLLPGLMGLRRSGVYRQTLFGNISLIFAAIFGKM